MNLRAIAHALGGQVSNRQVLFPGPGHSPRDRSAWLKLSPSAPDGILCGSFSGDDWRDVKDHVRARLGLARDDQPLPASRVAQPRPANSNDDNERTRRALDLWQGSVDPRDTIVETYLHRRGLELPAEAVGRTIRFHANCPFGAGGQRVAAMVCLVRDIATNDPRAVHRTALDREGNAREVDGKKRAALGPIGGGAIKITADVDVGTCLGIGEGVESVLSMRGLPEFGPSPVWALISAGAVSAFPALPGIESLWIAVDNDPPGERAAQQCSNRWSEAGREAFLVKPCRVGADLNDLARVA